MCQMRPAANWHNPNRGSPPQKCSDNDQNDQRPTSKVQPGLPAVKFTVMVATSPTAITTLLPLHRDLKDLESGHSLMQASKTP